jgi:transcriptional regulator with PAS, ATPase and Fis domain
MSSLYSSVSYQESSWESKVLDESRLEMGDWFEVIPLTGKKYKKQINRTAYEIISTFMGKISQDKLHQNDESRNEQLAFCKIELPTTQQENFHLLLKRIEVKNHQGMKVSRFQIESKNNRPFWYQGGLVYQLIIKDNDEIEFAHNRIRFFKNTEINMHKKKLSSMGELNPIDQISVEILQSKLPILITGPTGTGKTHLAFQIHQQSKRIGDFVHLNLSAYNENLLESELFGHAKGAFTGAIVEKKGAFERANYGTLFIDEIDSCSIALQVKLLLFLDNYMITPVGGQKARQVDCRLIFSSGTKLEKLVKDKKMREDFFYRISSGKRVDLPALNGNEKIIKKFVHDYLGTKQKYADKLLVDFYCQLPWPGNFRQLKGHLDKKIITSQLPKMILDDLDQELLGEDVSNSQQDDNDEIITLEELKIRYIKRVYYALGKDEKIVARKLGISWKCLKDKIDLWSL